MRLYSINNCQGHKLAACRDKTILTAALSLISPIITAISCNPHLTASRLHTFQTQCISCPDGAVWRTSWKTGSHLCWGHCLPLRPLLLHCAEMNKMRTTLAVVKCEILNVFLMLPRGRHSLLGVHCTHLQICGPIYLFLLYQCLNRNTRDNKQSLKDDAVNSKRSVLRCRKCSDSPIPVGSPVWTMKPLMFRWKMQPL